MKFYRMLLLTLIVVIALGACNLPTARPTAQTNPNAVFTAAAETVQVQLTKNALLNPPGLTATIAPPTITPDTVVDVQPTPAALPSNTQEPGIVASPTSPPSAGATSVCDAAQFIADVTIPDGSPFSSGTTFTKTWRLKNTGTCTWNSSYALVFDSGNSMGTVTRVSLSGTTAPGAFLDISVSLQAPATDGLYRGYWGLVNPAGVRLPVASGAKGNSFYVEIKVGSGVGGNATDSPGKFAVLSVSFSTARSEACSAAAGKYVVTATVSANKAGVVTYTWIRSDAVTSPEYSGSITFDSAGSKTINFEWPTTQPGLWVDLYIDNPNHQLFGRVNLNCQ